MRYVLTILLFSFISSTLKGQLNDNYKKRIHFEIVKFRGKLGNHPITLLLSIYPNNYMSGYYYYDKIGRFIKVEKVKNSSSLKLKTSAFEAFEQTQIEYFDFQDSCLSNKVNIKAQWTDGKKKLAVELHKDASKLEWRLLTINSIGLYPKSEFNVQEKDYHIIYPSIQSSPILNKYFLTKWIDSKKMIGFINCGNFNSLSIESDFGTDTLDNDIYSWNEIKNDELVYYTDSILTYYSNEFVYANNGQPWESYISIKVSDGKEIEMQDVFRSNSIDTVLSILKTKYKSILQNEPDPNKANTSESGAPYFSQFTKATSIFISPGGLYFRERLYKLADYYNLYLSNEEIKKNYLDSYKILINSPAD